ncbi:hypothetical protein [Spirosoma foliorum]|uniref:BDLP-like helical domain-containing protein n=1 Tax=Spirosoma foliorum TaxID=2710596 RepID=A0A7G5GRL4_9BACT|nr:hypothetical protein [Spirosoma foliorum]QMW01506.1 hypothetical protein H3H32_26620 [Spirosoma foliorum]
MNFLILFTPFFLGLSTTFEEDFGQYQPDLGFVDFLFRKEKRAEFEANLEAAFERYLRGKISEWTRVAEKSVRIELEAIALSAREYSVSYENTVDSIGEILTGGSNKSSIHMDDGDTPLWQRILAGGGAAIMGDLAGVVLASSGIFDWKKIVTNLIAVIVTGGLVLAITGTLLGPISLALLGLGVGGYQAERARQKVLRTMAEEIKKSLPNSATEGRLQVYQNVYNQFSNYSQDVESKLSKDIDERKGELDNVLASRKKEQINLDIEVNRLSAFAKATHIAREEVEDIHDNFFKN